MEFTIELGTDTDSGACACCGGRTRVIRGFVSDRHGARAVYVARWSPGRPQHDAAVALSIGGWGGASTEKICIGRARESLVAPLADGLIPTRLPLPPTSS